MNYNTFSQVQQLKKDVEQFAVKERTLQSEKEEVSSSVLSADQSSSSDDPEEKEV